MKSNLKSILIWLFAIVFTISIAAYQKITGPTYPKNGKVSTSDKEIKFKLLRSHSSSSDALISIKNVDTTFSGIVFFKRYNTDDEWQQVSMKYGLNQLVANLPAQPPAGKLIYRVFLKRSGENYPLTIEPVVIRFKGDVPIYILIPHILFMFTAMLLSTYTGLISIFNGKRLYYFSFLTTISLFVGGIILGPIVQKFAFGAYWTGWPLGHDLTDNKTAIAFIFWLIATIVLYKNKKNKIMAIIAAIVLLLVYLIPHSMWGSELDYKSGIINTGNKPISMISIID